MAAGIGGYLLFGGGQKPFPSAILPSPCTTNAAATFATAKALPCAHPRPVHIGGSTFDAAVHNGFTFVSYSTGLAVANTASLTPKVIRNIRLSEGHEARGEALTRGNKYLLVAGGSGITVFKVSDLEQGNYDQPCSLSGGRRDAEEVTTSRDGQFAFVTLQTSGQVAVFSLQRAQTPKGCVQPHLIQTIRVGSNPVGIARSTDGHYLYVTTGLGVNATTGKGYLVILDMRKAEKAKSRSPVVNTVDPHAHGLARVLPSPDGKYVWATVGGGNTLLAFSAADLLDKHKKALIARVTVGQAPLGLVLVKNGTRIVVADSNRYPVRGSAPDLAVIDVHKALKHKHAVLGIIKSFAPRQLALESDKKTLLVTNFGSGGWIEAVNVSQLP